jgi:hypothetical protein
MNLKDQQLVADAFEGSLDEAGFQKLQERLRDEPALLAHYRDQALLHHSLCEEFEGRHMIDDPVPHVAAKRWQIYTLLGMALLLLGFAGWGVKRLFPPAAMPGGKAMGADVAGSRSGSPASEEDSESMNLETSVLLEDRFETGAPLAGRRPATGASFWRLEKGAPELKAGHLEGSGFEAYFSLPPESLSPSQPVLLATIETVAAPSFHTAGWAGFSLYQDGYEICFFGDSYGPEETWSLDVKRRLLPLMPSPLLPGPRTMTLRYDRRDGTIEVHEGGAPTGNPVVRSKILPGMTFDQIRIGASDEATLALSRIHVRAVRSAAGR